MDALITLQHRQGAPINRQCLTARYDRNSNFEKNILEECMLVSKVYAYSQGALVLEVLVQEGPSCSAYR